MKPDLRDLRAPIAVATGSPPARTRSRGPVLLALASLLLGAACGSDEESFEITDVRVHPDAGPAAPPGNTEEQRFGDPEEVAEADAPPRRRFAFRTPEGWTELPPASMRDHGWRVGPPDGAAECTLSVLEGEAGGVLANVNRWRVQMSLPPVGGAEVLALPTTPWLGVDARRVELEGTWRGMSGATSLPGARLLGLVAVLPGATAFLKLTGPAAVVEAERDRFLALASSIRFEEGAPRASPMQRTAESPPAPTEALPTGPRPRRTLSWTAPDEWIERPPRGMRLVTFSPKDAPDVVVASVTVLPGDGGGMRPNVDRWYGEMGLPAPTDEQVAALPRASVLGREAVFLEIDGSFRGMGATVAEPGQTLLGTIVLRERDAVFVKMTGPTERVRAERARFRAFAESLR